MSSILRQYIILSYHYPPHHIRNNVLPAPVVALGAIVVHLLGYCHHRRHDRADDRKDNAHTEVLHLVLACIRVVTIAHCSFCKVTELDYHVLKVFIRKNKRVL